MSNYRIITDSCADFPRDMIPALDIDIVQLSLLFRGNELVDPSDAQIQEMYNALRAGESASTSAVNPLGWKTAIEPVLASGKDALVLVFSSGLSTTYQSAVIAAEELAEEYPDRTVKVVDTLCASLGQGLFVWYACKKRDEGLSLEELYAWCEDHKLNLAHWFTVDDLMFLKRGGRISAATAVVGTMLNIKPIIAVRNGVVENVGKARGPKAADRQVRELVANAGGIDFSKPMCAAYSGLEDDNLQNFLSESTEMLCDTELPIASVGCVIGAHVGPGAVAVAFFHN